MRMSHNHSVLMLTAAAVCCIAFCTVLNARQGKKKNDVEPVTKTDLLSRDYVSKVWVADNGDGTYRNPVICADYSDPDVCAGDDGYYMTASSFNCIPGLPILHSYDLVNWTLVGHALARQLPEEVFSAVRHGDGVWAPCIRRHAGKYYIYYGDPDQGIFMVRTDDPRGRWEPPVLVKAGKGLIDPTVLWDDDGTAYLIHAYAGSRAGIKSILTACRMSEDGERVLSDETIIFDGHDGNPTVEGPKIYKYNGYYYIFTPAGGVATGWQLVLRSRNIYGPYEQKTVLAQGSTAINGPHQGGWVTTPSGESWFLHFQDAGAYGRVVHLQPVVWKDGWPVMGNDPDGDGTGEPVLTYRKPNVGRSYPSATPVESDEFDSATLGLQWQWPANPAQGWGFPIPSKGVYRLFSVVPPEDMTNYRDLPAMLLQKLPAYRFTATVKLDFNPYHPGEKTGLAIMGDSYAYIAVTNQAQGLEIAQVTCERAINGAAERTVASAAVQGRTFYLRIQVADGATCTFSYSTDGQTFQTLGEPFRAVEGRWIGAKMGMFCTRTNTTNNAGYADLDWFRVTP